jgi:glucokinase
MREMTLGVDLSDLVARCALVDGDGSLLASSEAPASAALEPTAVREAARRAISEAKGRVAAVGVALPGAFDQLPPKIAAALRDVTPRDQDIVPVAAGTAAAMAEQWTGAARGLKHVVSFAIAEHVTAGVLMGGEPWAGAHGFASSLPWLAMNPVEREDYRRYGGLEAEIASAGIVRRFVWRIKAGDESALADKVKGDFTKITAADIFQSSRDGDGVSISVIRDTIKYVGMAVANMATMFDPEVIVLGGVIARSGDQMIEQVRTECGRRLHPKQFDLVRIVSSALGNDAAAIGAARAAARVAA